MPCDTIKPDITEDFIDKEGISRPVDVFVNKSIEKKSTIAFLFGGYKYERTNKIIVGTKGWNNKDKPLKPKECETIKELTDLGWRLLVFDTMQFVTPDGTPHNEMWIEDYVEWIDKKFNDDKRFMIGFSSGAYIVGLHLRHLADGQGRSEIPAYGMFSFSVELGNPHKKTDYAEIDFSKKPILFLSGSSKLDNSANKPFVNGFKNTRTLYTDFACHSELHSDLHPEIRHGWQALESDHVIFEADTGGKKIKRAVTNIIDDWFVQYPNLPKQPLANKCYTSQEEGIKNPDSCN